MLKTGHFECDDMDFLIIVCDGVSEGDFSNKQVVELVAEHLDKDDENLCAIARAVCHRAIETNFKDNITCMIVLFTPKDGGKPNGIEFIPGPLYNISHKAFMKAYGAMATKGGHTIEEAVDLRYEALLDDVAVLDGTSEKRKELQAEHGNLTEDAEEGAPPGTKGSEERLEYFRNLLEKQDKCEPPNAPGQPAGILDLIRSNLGLLNAVYNTPQRGAGALGPDPSGTPVRVAQISILKTAVEEHPKLKWDDRLEKIAGEVGSKLLDDPSDGTSQVAFEKDGFTCWLPTDTLHDEI